MSRRALKARDVCQLCEFIKTRQFYGSSIQPLRKTINSPRLFSGRRIYSKVARDSGLENAAVKTNPQTSRGNGTIATDAQLEKTLHGVRAICNTLLMQEKVPSEKDVLRVLERCKAMADLLILDQSTAVSSKKDVAASALLSLDDAGAKTVFVHKLPRNIQGLVDQLSDMTYSILKFPPVFITAEILQRYVAIQSDLGKPETFPEILKLYPHKPIPEEGTFPIRYSSQNPNRAANAVPLKTADRALQAAIDAKQLVVAMDIIEACHTTKASRRAKFVRQGLLPVAGLAGAPIAAYTIASQLAILQTTMETGMATNVAFAGMLAYMGFTATIGVVAISTANDQMDRVTWAQGVPLRQRWIREEERAAIDKVAGAWGFREAWRRGEEEGEDWDALREWIGRKSMMLDRVELLEGME
ncbi:hypothetical protein QTJ16_004068 [Diplocarpon rosae]|uniref:Uncharacterized protein n=1 Tax=Diplocarpon rosae TaxID=946125 RepID=A0AAD9T131_9HELO|nr:hypothetical protein QTJ16_004068 [Diplocarpon rosae]PBP18675.1 hypothetical protein BUE80_DR010544 [Diplocarpon rosae]